MMGVLRLSLRAALALLAVNVLLSLAPAIPQFEFAGIRFPAHSAAKPLLLLNGALVLYLLLLRRTAGEGGPPPPRTGERFWFPWALLGAVLAVYLPSLRVNFQDRDWTHRHVGAMLTSLASVGRLFTAPQVDGMYRPLAFLSFRADYWVFGPAFWAYHLQSIALHLLNAFLVGRLASRLGFDRATSRTAAFLFGLGAVYCEAVVWPAARFDLLAAAFSLVAILFFLKFWRGAGSRAGSAMVVLVSFVAGVLNKETAYSLVLLIPALIVTHRMWDLPPEGKRRALWLAGALAVCAVVLLGVRFSLYGGVGGYRDGGAIGAKSVYSLVVNTLALSIFGINSTVPTPASAVIVALYVCAVLALAFHYAGRAGARMWALAGCALLAAVPIVSVAGWIRPSLQHARHLYWPSVWIALLLALALGRCSRRSAVTALFVLAQATGLTYNIWVYRDLLSKAVLGADQVSRDLIAADASNAEVRLIGIPNEPNGMPYVESEIQERIRQAEPAAFVRHCPDPAACGASPEGRPVFAYVWDDERRTIRRLGR
jgi:hypothetical protein